MLGSSSPSAQRSVVSALVRATADMSATWDLLVTRHILFSFSGEVELLRQVRVRRRNKKRRADSERRVPRERDWKGWVSVSERKSSAVPFFWWDFGKIPEVKSCRGYGGSLRVAGSHDGITGVAEDGRGPWAGSKQMYPLLFGVFGFRALCCLGLWGFRVLRFYGLTKW